MIHINTTTQSIYHINIIKYIKKIKYTVILNIHIKVSIMEGEDYENMDILKKEMKRLLKL